MIQWAAATERPLASQTMLPAPTDARRERAKKSLRLVRSRK